MNRDEAVTLLKKITTVTPRKGTDFVDITVKHSPKDQAIRIANAIAQVGVERGSAIQKSRSKRIDEALDEELINQEKRIAAHRKDLVTLFKEDQLDLPPEGEPFQKASFDHIQDTVDRSLRQHTHKQAIETYTQSRAMLHEMKIKQQETRIRIKGPHTPITIHQRAK